MKEDIGGGVLLPNLVFLAQAGGSEPIDVLAGSARFLGQPPEGPFEYGQCPMAVKSFLQGWLGACDLEVAAFNAGQGERENPLTSASLGGAAARS
jgi:hypothetical protein